ncbi:HypC/HybG/HupF family hydrogenase formation chaperone [Euzebya sp.]|uniref:HypC/HybG/HupF family hydrogenase formation chaperone n=1 Tax=Euzebya sp. TaxID=1971409 RepID=UPI0035135290
MCLGIPGRIIEIGESDGARMGRVDFDGIVKEVCLEYLPELEVGDYTIVHVGFAITKLDEDSAMETLALMRRQGVLAEELDPAAAERAADWGAGT